MSTVFELVQKVELPDGSKGFIDAVMTSLETTKFHVIYWDNGVRREEWVYANEMTRIDSYAMRG